MQRETVIVMSLFFLSIPVVLTGQQAQHSQPYPETPDQIAAYKDHVTDRFHGGICFYPENVTTVSSLEELARYSGRSGVHVRMEPGTYNITPENYQKFVGKTTLKSISPLSTEATMKSVCVPLKR